MSNAVHRVHRDQAAFSGALRVLPVAFLLAAAVPVAARGQFNQYSTPQDLEERREPMAELLEHAMREARWRVGRVFLDPWVSLHDVAYIDNLGGRTRAEKGSDVTATVGAGIRGYRPVGPELTLAFHALPEYVWWRKLEERRGFNGRYGAGLFGDLGRTGLELAITRQETSGFFSRELEEPLTLETDTAEAAIEVDLVGSLAAFSGGSLRRYGFPGDEETPERVGLLERDEEILRAGLRFELGRLEIGLGVEDSTVEFDSPTLDRSNSGTAPLLQLDFEGPVVNVSTLLAARDLEPEPGSVFPAYEEVTGSLWATSRPTGRTEIQLFADRNLVYALDARWAYFEDTYYGAGVAFSLGPVASVRAYAGQGTNDYTAYEPGTELREDDYDTVGAELRVLLGRFQLRLGARTTDYDSSLPQFDRSVTVLSSGVSLGRGGGSPWG